MVQRLRKTNLLFVKEAEQKVDQHDNRVSAKHCPGHT